MAKINLKHCIYLFAATAVIAFYSCASSPTDQYNKLVNVELAKGTRYDSLFLGISFGMTSKTFYGYCWELNKKGVISDGANNTMVLYKLPTELKFPANMNFYPDFHENKVFHMRVTYQYNAWAPWNRAQWADTLLPDVVRLYKKWYPGGNDFIKMTDKAKGIIYVKVDGNRRIIIGKNDDMIVRADFMDLTVEQKLKK